VGVLSGKRQREKSRIGQGKKVTKSILLVEDQTISTDWK
jgi:hypothetical protein